MEQELRNALRRKQPSADFAQRVMKSVAAGISPRNDSALKRAATHHWRAVAAALTLTAILGGWAAHTIAERRAGERARDEVLLALRIAGSKVHYAQSQVHDIGRK